MFTPLRPYSQVGETPTHTILTDRGSKSLEVQALGTRRRESLKAELVCFIQVLSPLAAIFKHSIPWLAESAFLDVEGHWAELSLSLLLASKGRCPRQWTRTRTNGSNFPHLSWCLPVSPLPYFEVPMLVGPTGLKGKVQGQQQSEKEIGVRAVKLLWPWPKFL